MILLSTPNGEHLEVNAQFIESAEAASDTVITLVDGTSYIVAESVPEIEAKVRVSQAWLLADLRLSSGGRRPDS